MARQFAAKVGALLFSVALAALLVPGCTLRLGKGDGDGTEEARPAPNEAPPEPAGEGGAGSGSDDIAPEESAEEALARVDPQQLALAEAKAALTTAYLVATVESSGQDPSALDEAALEQLMRQYLPAAAAEADA